MIRATLILSLLAAPCMGEPCRTRVAIQHIDTGLTIVPYAIPVAAPVAQVALGQPLYSVSPGYQAPQAQAKAESVEDVFAEFQQFLEWKKSRATVQAKQTAVQAKCASCHGAASQNAKARDHLKLESMNAEDRLAAVQAITSDRMPPNASKQPLDGKTAGELILELSRTPVKASVLPSPPKTE